MLKARRAGEVKTRPGREIGIAAALTAYRGEGLCILCEEPRQTPPDGEALRAEVQRHVTTRTGVTAVGIHIVRRNSVI